MTDKETAVKVDHLTKTFKIPTEASNGIKQKLINGLKGKKGYREFTPLKDISFEINKGDFFGIVGRNGSGKSTLLKSIANIYTPTKGGVHVKGTLVPFIELGVGFNPELTGRENVYLNGALLGFSRKQMEAMYDEIVDFAEIGEFMDEKLKNYSSGMQVRLAFSIAIKAEGDILLLDEVLAVGDEAFQRKCIAVFEKYKARKQTIILVTHDMSVVERFCSRALMLEDGNVVAMGSPSEIARRYSEANKADYVKSLAENKAKNFNIHILDPKTKKPKKLFNSGDKALIRVSWTRDGVGNVGVALLKQSGEYVFGPNTYNDKYILKKGSRSIDYLVELNVGSGDYFLKAGLFGVTSSEVLEFVDQGPTILVENATSNQWGGITKLKHEWIQD